MKDCLICRSEDSELFCLAEDRDRPGEHWEIWRCRQCGGGWTMPEIPPEEIGAYYPPSYLGDMERTLDKYRSGKLQRSRSWRRELLRIRFLERFVQGGRILDVGSGSGLFLLALDNRRWQRTGVEFVAEVVQALRNGVPSLELHAGDVHSASLAPATFDVITFWHVFEHLYEPRRVLTRAAELLKPGGLLLLSVPNFDSWQARLFRRHWYAFDVPRHLRHYSPRGLELLLEQCGFSDPRHAFFSRMENFHQLKHSLVHWSEEKFGNRVPYYFLKPLLFGFQAVEGLTKQYATLTTIAKRSGPAEN